VTALAPDRRRLLEAVVIDARMEAEAAAKAALQALAVDHHEAFQQMSPEDRDLRIRLRARARQLGDPRELKRGTQAIRHLVGECAYEHWHRMLFARFLAENDFLIEPDSGVAVSLDECRELARERREDPWVLASRFAQRMLPQIFRPDDPVLQVGLSREHRSRLESLLEKLPPEIFLADDSLGWVYQFWQSKRKDEVNAAGGKIGADELASVTQLFTEHYIVLFLLHNTIGAWHAGKVLIADPDLARSAKNEEELRQACTLSGYHWDYLRFVRDEEGKMWRPAAGAFEKWPRTAREITVMDPCCGSGHFLVAVFECLVRLRMVEEGFSPEKAVEAVLTENLFGLELDPRCTQLAAFALAFTAWRFIGRVISLAPFNMACSGLSVGVREEEWTLLAGDDARLRKGMEQLYALFRQGPELGSLIDPQRVISGDLYTAEFRQLRPLLDAAFGAEKAREDASVIEVGVAAQGMAYAAELLARKYTLVITNVPYLARGKQGQILKDHLESYYTEGKADLATAFVIRCLSFLTTGGTAAAVTPQNWLFMTTYRPLRERLLKELEWDVLGKLGEHGFESSAAAGAFTAMLILSNSRLSEIHVMSGLDASALRRPGEKAEWIRTCNISLLLQVRQLRNPDARVMLESISTREFLSKYADSYIGFQNGDTPRFILEFWEIHRLSNIWEFLQMTTDSTVEFDGRSSVLRWEKGKGDIREYAYVKGTEAWNKSGIAVRLMRKLQCSLYNGNFYDQSSAVIIPRDPSCLAAIWCYCSSPEFNNDVRKIDQALKVTNATLIKVPFDLVYWQKVAADCYPNGLPRPYSNDPTQWVFHGHPSKSIESLQVTDS